MGERTTRVRIYARTYVHTWGVRGREHARKKDTYVRTYVRTCVRWSTYVRAYVRAREGTHATRIRWSTYVRTDVASGATESCGSHGRERHYVRTYLRTYVRKGGRLFFWNPHSVLIASVNQGTYGRTYAGSASNGTRSSPPTGSCTPTS